MQRGAYDERQQFFEGVGESALLGGLVGKTVRGGAEAFGAATRKLNSINTAVGEELEAARDESEAPVTFNLRVRDLKDPSRQVIEQRHAPHFFKLAHPTGQVVLETTVMVADGSQ